MKVYALLSYWDEKPEHLTRCVRSLAGFCDHLIAVDGHYSTFSPERAYSAAEQHIAVCNAALQAKLRQSVYPALSWSSEVAKRAAMFEKARQRGATPDDWLLIIDADTALAENSRLLTAREALATTDLDVAEVRWQDMMVNGMPSSTLTFRSLFRAMAGLTVERTHFLYTVPDADADRGRRFVWHAPSGQISHEPALDLTDALTLHHFNSQREQDRKQRALRYYENRAAEHLESAGDWRA